MEFWKFDSNVVSKNMLALQSYEQNEGFSVMSTDELLELEYQKTKNKTGD